MKFLFYSLQDDIEKKWRHKVLFMRTNYGRRFTTVVTDLIIISSTRTHAPSVVQEGFIGLIPCIL